MSDRSNGGRVVAQSKGARCIVFVIRGQHLVSPALGPSQPAAKHARTLDRPGSSRCLLAFVERSRGNGLDTSLRAQNIRYQHHVSLLFFLIGVDIKRSTLLHLNCSLPILPSPPLPSPPIPPASPALSGHPSNPCRRAPKAHGCSLPWRMAAGTGGRIAGGGILCWVWFVCLARLVCIASACVSWFCEVANDSRRSRHATLENVCS